MTAFPCMLLTDWSMESALLNFLLGISLCPLLSMEGSPRGSCSPRTLGAALGNRAAALPTSHGLSASLPF